jgi:hypothetical protein
MLAHARKGQLCHGCAGTSIDITQFLQPLGPDVPEAEPFVEPAGAVRLGFMLAIVGVGFDSSVVPRLASSSYSVFKGPATW